MADDPSLLETEISAITERMKELKKELDELGASDMDKGNRLQDKISRLHEKREQLKDRWKKALTGIEG